MRSHPKVSEMLEEAEYNLLAFCQFPLQHWRRIWSINPLERVNKEIERRTDVDGPFPNSAAPLRPAGHIVIEQHDEWGGADRRYFGEHSSARRAASRRLDRSGEAMEGTRSADTGASLLTEGREGRRTMPDHSCVARSAIGETQTSTR